MTDTTKAKRPKADWLNVMLVADALDRSTSEVLGMPRFWFDRAVRLFGEKAKNGN